MEEWIGIDLHMHTCEGITGDGKRDEIKNFTYKNYINSLTNFDISLAAITNHNSINMVNYILCRYLGRKKDINVLFGVEIDTDRENGDNFHFVAIFNEPLNKCIEIAEQINSNTENKKTTGKVRYTSEEIVKIIKNYNVIIVPHGVKSKGLLKDVSECEIKEALKKVRDGFIRVFDSPSDWKLARIKQLIEDDSYSVSIDEFGGVLFSDNRDWLNYGKNNRNFCMNAEPTFNGFLHAITNPTQRFSPRNLISHKSNYISKMIIKHKNDLARIADCEITFKSGYNCIIGKSGSGKSLLHYLIKKNIVNGVLENGSYGFSENNIIELYDENNNIINVGSINVGVGANIFNMIVTASDTKDSNDMYKVIRSLKKDFKIKSKYNEYANKYRNYLKSYINLKSKLNDDINSFQTDINLFVSENKELCKLKLVDVFSIDIPDDIRFVYSYDTIKKMNLISKSVSTIKQTLNLFNDDLRKQLENKLEDFSNEYYKQLKNIYINYTKENIINLKRKLVRDSLSSVNKGISNNASRKTQIINSMPTKISEITKLLLQCYIKNIVVAKYDVSFKVNEMNCIIDLIPGTGITVSEIIDENEIKKMNIKNNNIFFTRGIQQQLHSEEYDMTDKEESKLVIDTYFNYKKMTENDIDKVFGDDINPNVDVYFDGQNVKELNPGDISKKYINVYFENELANGKNTIILYDQLENDVDKSFINDTILERIDAMKQKAQVIIVTHDPIIAVNADPVNYIEAKKDSNGIIKYRSFVPESSIRDELNTIAINVDGSKGVIKERYEIYRGDKNYDD